MVTRPLEGRIAAVTGGASGIGLETARALIESGCRVHLLDRDEAALRAAQTELGSAAVRVAIDLLDYPAMERAVADIVSADGGIDILYANAGRYVGGNIWEGDISTWDDMLNLNVNATFRAVRAVLPPMMERGGGDIVVTSSIAGAVPIVAEPIYTASKHAVQAFVHTVRRQVASYGIRVSAVLPGPVSTALLKDWDPARLKEQIDAGALMEPRDVADAVVFMLTRRKGVVVRDLVILPHSFDV